MRLFNRTLIAAVSALALTAAPAFADPATTAVPAAPEVTAPAPVPAAPAEPQAAAPSVTTPSASVRKLRRRSIMARSTITASITRRRLRTLLPIQLLIQPNKIGYIAFGRLMILGEVSSTADLFFWLDPRAFETISLSDREWPML